MGPGGKRRASVPNHATPWKGLAMAAADLAPAPGASERTAQRGGYACARSSVAAVHRQLQRLPAGRGPAGTPRRAPVALHDRDLQHGRAADDRRAPGPGAAWRKLRDACWRLAHGARAGHARGLSVRHPGRAEPARRPRTPRRPCQRTCQHRRRGERRLRRFRDRDPAAHSGGGYLARAVRRAGQGAVRQVAVEHGRRPWWRQRGGRIRLAAPAGTGGTITAAALAEETGWSGRHLRARFAAEFGITPKAAARVVRFDRARRLLQRRAASGRPLELAALAAHCGFYDQAHLDGEFRSFAGAPPTTWLAREFRNLQAWAAEPAES